MFRVCRVWGKKGFGVRQLTGVTFGGSVSRTPLHKGFRACSTWPALARATATGHVFVRAEECFTMLHAKGNRMFPGSVWGILSASCAVWDLLEVAPVYGCDGSGLDLLHPKQPASRAAAFFHLRV